MNKTEYQHVIQEMCHHTGISDWREIADLQHVQVDDVTVGLMYRDEFQPGCDLFLYFDFGPLETPGLAQKLLALNVAFQTEGEGHFGSHAGMSAIVYRVGVSLVSERKGVELAEKIQYFLGVGQQRLQCAAQSGSNQY